MNGVTSLLAYDADSQWESWPWKAGIASKEALLFEGAKSCFPLLLSQSKHADRAELVNEHIDRVLIGPEPQRCLDDDLDSRIPTQQVVAELLALFEHLPDDRLFPDHGVNRHIWIVCVRQSDREEALLPLIGLGFDPLGLEQVRLLGQHRRELSTNALREHPNRENWLWRFG